MRMMNTGSEGPPGQDGEQGPPGRPGAHGHIGPQGIQGETGLTGSQGIQGETGLTGSQGIQGETGPPGEDGHQFVDRGDPDAADFNLTDFTLDLTWRDLDLSGIIPEGTVLVMLRVTVKSSAAGNYIQFRKKGNVHQQNYHQCTCQVTNRQIMADVFIVPIADRCIKYLGSGAGFATMAVTVGGWWV